MKNLIKAALTVMFVMAAMQVTNAQISGSAHDLSTTGGDVTSSTTQKCVFCHTPHSQSATQYLWNRTASTAGYTMYSSPTMEQTISSPGDASKRCLSCHDGTVAYNSLINNPGSGATGTAITMSENTMGGWDSLGVDLSNDHPIGMNYSTSQTADAGLRAGADGSGTKNATVTNGTVILPLSGHTYANATVECTSCHDPHNTTGVTEFLRVPNTGSQICLTCHIK